MSRSRAMLLPFIPYIALTFQSSISDASVQSTNFLHTIICTHKKTERYIHVQSMVIEVPETH